jgi:hypothetical protein
VEQPTRDLLARAFKRLPRPPEWADDAATAFPALDFFAVFAAVIGFFVAVGLAKETWLLPVAGMLGAMGLIVSVADWRARYLREVEGDKCGSTRWVLVILAAFLVFGTAIAWPVIAHLKPAAVVTVSTHPRSPPPHHAGKRPPQRSRLAPKRPVIAQRSVAPQPTPLIVYVTLPPAPHVAPTSPPLVRSAPSVIVVEQPVQRTTVSPARRAAGPSQIVATIVGSSNTDPSTRVVLVNSAPGIVEHLRQWGIVLFQSDPPVLTFTGTLEETASENRAPPGGGAELTFGTMMRIQRPAMPVNSPIWRVWMYYVYENTAGEVIEDDAAFFYDNDHWVGLRKELLPQREQLLTIARKNCGTEALRKRAAMHEH